ncbi:MAG: DUF5668 domain-containing protein [bacterium]|nr:DUF5668 domain-containing protein [bacterium]
MDDRTTNSTTYRMEFKNSSGHGGRYVIGFLLVALGVSLLLNSFGLYDFGDFFGTWWPTALMIVAVVQIATGRTNWFWSGVLFLVGALLQASELGMLPGGFWSAFWPAVIILAGISLVFKRGHKKKASLTSGGDAFFGGSTQNVSGDRVDRSAVFSGQELRVSSRNFAGGELTAVFGGIELDLRDAEIDSGNAMLAVTAVFGGIEIRVPPHWNVVVQGTPIFGGIEDKTRRTFSEGVNGPVLLLDVTAVFGGVEIGN